MVQTQVAGSRCWSRSMAKNLNIAIAIEAIVVVRRVVVVIVMMMVMVMVHMVDVIMATTVHKLVPVRPKVLPMPMSMGDQGPMVVGYF